MATMQNSRGFTLIELLIVVAIIALLATIGLPAYRDYTQRSANGACMAEAKSWMSAAISDIVAHRTRDPYSGTSCSSAVPAQLTTVQYHGGSSIVFIPPTRGNASLIRNTRCNASTGTCTIDP